MRFSDHENNATKIGDELNGALATRDEILYHLGLRKREFVPTVKPYIPSRVVVEMEVPESELTGSYKAKKAKDSVGAKQRKAGVIQGQLSGTREVILSRWAKPVRIVPDAEVTESIAKQIEGQVEVMPSNVVTPQVREEMEKRGVKFVETDNTGIPRILIILFVHLQNVNESYLLRHISNPMKSQIKLPTLQVEIFYQIQNFEQYISITVVNTLLCLVKNIYDLTGLQSGCSATRPILPFWRA